MHPEGKEGSHKDPAAEIWAFDVKSRKRIARAAGNNAVALAVSRGKAPRLFAIDPLTAGIVSYETAPTLAPLKRVDGFGEAPSQIETH
jgi:methylamine dehydrogenase heavy chain